MLEVTKNKVNFSVDLSDPVIKMFYALNPKKVQQAVIEVDLHSVFEAVAANYGLGVCAELVQNAMEKTSDHYKKDA